MDKWEIFETLQRIESKLDQSICQQQKRCDEVSAEQRKAVNSKVSNNMFQWVVGFIISGMISLGGYAAYLGHKVVGIEAKYKNPIVEDVRGDANKDLTFKD